MYSTQNYVHFFLLLLIAISLLAAKSTSYAANANAAEIILSIVRESLTHTTFCAEWGVSLSELESTPESLATMAYGAYMIDIGLQGKFILFRKIGDYIYVNVWAKVMR